MEQWIGKMWGIWRRWFSFECRTLWLISKSWRRRKRCMGGSRTWKLALKALLCPRVDTQDHTEALVLDITLHHLLPLWKVLQLHTIRYIVVLFYSSSVLDLTCHLFIAQRLSRSNTLSWNAPMVLASLASSCSRVFFKFHIFAGSPHSKGTSCGLVGATIALLCASPRNVTLMIVWVKTIGKGLI